MPVAYTSRLAYKEEFSRLCGQRKRVWECVRQWPAPGSLPSIEDIANATDLRVASVCGRVNELTQAGLLQEHKPKHSPTTGKLVKTYIALQYREEPIRNPDPVQPDLFGELHQTKEYY